MIGCLLNVFFFFEEEELIPFFSHLKTMKSIHFACIPVTNDRCFGQMGGAALSRWR